MNDPLKEYTPTMLNRAMAKTTKKATLTMSGADCLRERRIVYKVNLEISEARQ